MAVAVHQRRQVERAGTVEAAMRLGDLLAEEPVGSDQRLAGAVLDHQMIADGIERIGIPAGRDGRGIGPGRALLVEHPVAQPLCRRDLVGGGRQPYHKIHAFTARAPGNL